MSAASQPTVALGPATDREEARFVWMPLILAIVAVWLVPLGSSMGLDESGNWWVIKDGWTEMLKRAAVWPGGQSILFNASVMAARAVAGDSDIVLRLPSVIMMCGALVFLYRLGIRSGGPLVAMSACLALVVQREVVYVASSLRPYALGIFLATAAMWALLNWLDTGNFGYAVVYVFCAGLTPYANYLHGSMFLVHAACASWRLWLRRTPVRIWHLIAAWIGCGLVMIPLIEQALSLYGRRGQEGYLDQPNLAEFALSVFPALLTGAVLFSIVAYAAASWLGGSTDGDSLVREWAQARREALDPLLWSVLPPLALVVLGMFTDLRLFAGRYYVVNGPGVALLAGIGMRSLAAAPLRRYLPIVIAVSAMISLGFQEGFMRGLFDYRGAVAGLRNHVHDDETPVVFVSGFVESRNMQNVTDPSLSQALMAPILRYHAPGRLIVVPSALTGEAETYLADIFDKQIKSHPRFILCGLFGAEFYRTWFVGRAGIYGFQLSMNETYGGVGVMVFEKR